MSARTPSGSQQSCEQGGVGDDQEREEDRVWHSRVMTEIPEQFPEAQVEQASAELIGLLVHSSKVEGLHAAKAVDGQGPEARWK